MTPRQSLSSRLGRWSRRLTFGKVSLGPGRRPRRSRRLKVYETATTFRAAPGFSGQVGNWVGQRLAGLLLAALVAALLYLAFGTSWFYIYDMEVVGAQHLTKAELYNRSNLEGWSIFWLNPTAVARRLEAEPMVARAMVSALPPNRVRVQVNERVPVAVWQSGETSLFVDGDGVLFGLRGDATQMLVIRDLHSSPVAAGEEVDPLVVRGVRELAQLIPQRRAFDWEPGLGLSFLTDGGWRVAFGDYTRLRAKVAAFHAFETQIQSEKEILLLDLSVPEHPYYRVSP